MQANDYLPRFDAVIQLMKGIKANALLDLGCGDGDLTLKMAQTLEASEIYGVDINDKALKVAETKGIKVFKVDLSKDRIPLPNESIDVITALEVIEHLLNPDHMIKEAYRILKRRGLFFYINPKPCKLG